MSTVEGYSFLDFRQIITVNNFFLPATTAAIGLLLRRTLVLYQVW